MKFIIQKKNKRFLLLVLCLAIVVIGLQIYTSVTSPGTVVNETVLFEYSFQPSLNYQVNIHENDVYEGTVMEEDLTYSKRILDNIVANYAVSYKASKSVALHIDYQIVAVVNGYQGGEDKNILWSKEFPLTDKKVIEIESDSWNAEETVSFTLDDYDAFANRANEITGIKVSNEVVIEMRGNIVANTPEEVKTVPINTNLSIPLLEDVFKINKSNIELVNDSIVDSKRIPAPLNQTKILLFSILLTLCLVGVIILLFFSKEPSPLESVRRKSKGVIKNYGSRIVALKNMPKFDYRQIYKVDSIKDLIKISDEIEKPIIYESDTEDVIKNHELYLIDEDKLYIWEII